MFLSVIIPCFNEESVIGETYRRLSAALTGTSPDNKINDMINDYELIFINDGSRDRTLEILREICIRDPRVKVISLSRNFGHQNAVSAGIHHCKGDVAITIDADLQDPPELIPEMVKLYLKSGCNVVYAVRNRRQGESIFKRVTSKLYYRILNLLSSEKFPVDSGDFRLIDRKVIDTYRGFPERNKYIRGLIGWMGFKQIPLHYSRDERYAGESKYTLGKMVWLAKTGIFSFSKKPLQLATSVAVITILIALALSIWAFYVYFNDTGNVVPGWASTVIIILFLGGVQLFSIGILGEYIGSIFDEIKNRPEYIIDDYVNYEVENESQKDR